MLELSEKWEGRPELKVLVRNAQGKYLAQDPNGLFFTDDRQSAVVLRYQADHVREQLECLRQTYGVSLVADPVPLEEIYETCDQCRDWFMPYMLFYDGSRFLCADCRARKSVPISIKPARPPGPATLLR